MNINKGISVIIPCLNSEATIKQCIESVISQDTLGALEIILSDDGSTDKTLEIAGSLDKRVVILKTPDNYKEHGASGARNRGILASRYEYICFLDSDDYYLPGYLYAVSSFLNKNQDFGYTFCRAKKEIKFKNGDIQIEDWTRKKMSRLDREYHVLYRPYNINTNVICVRKSVFEKAGLFDTALSNGEDSDMWIRISELSTGKFIDVYGAVYRINFSQNQLSKNPNEIKSFCSRKIYAKAIKRYIESPENNKMRLLMIVRMLLYIRLTSKRGGVFTICRHTNVAFRLFFFFPRTFIKFITHAII